MTHAEIYSDASHDAATNCAGWTDAVCMRGIRATRSGVLSDVTIQRQNCTLHWRGYGARICTSTIPVSLH